MGSHPTDTSSPHLVPSSLIIVVRRNRNNNCILSLIAVFQLGVSKKQVASGWLCLLPLVGHTFLLLPTLLLLQHRCHLEEALLDINDVLLVTYYFAHLKQARSLSCP